VTNEFGKIEVSDGLEKEQKSWQSGCEIPGGVY
jgi:hypothetical protein